jgi:hypothetical protein
LAKILRIIGVELITIHGMVIHVVLSHYPGVEAERRREASPAAGQYYRKR